MIKPVFLKGRELERTLTDGVEVGATTLSVNEGTDFSAGDPVLVSDGDGGSVEYVGVVIASASDSITVSLGLRQARSTGSLVWRAVSAMAWRSVTASPGATVYDQGVRSERLVGGGIASVRLGAETIEERMRFTEISLQEFMEFRSWLKASANGGLVSFTRVDEVRSLAIVRLLDTSLERREGSPGTLALELRLAIIEPGGYA